MSGASAGLAATPYGGPAGGRHAPPGHGRTVLTAGTTRDHSRPRRSSPRSRGIRRGSRRRWIIARRPPDAHGLRAASVPGPWRAPWRQPATDVHSTAPARSRDGSAGHPARPPGRSIALRPPVKHPAGARCDGRGRAARIADGAPDAERAGCCPADCFARTDARWLAPHRRPAPRCMRCVPRDSRRRGGRPGTWAHRHDMQPMDGRCAPVPVRQAAAACVPDAPPGAEAGATAGADRFIIACNAASTPAVHGSAAWTPPVA